MKVAECRSPPCSGEGRPLISFHVYVILVFSSSSPVLIFISRSLYRLKLELHSLFCHGSVYRVRVMRLGWGLAEAFFITFNCLVGGARRNFVSWVFFSSSLVLFLFHINLLASLGLSVFRRFSFCTSVHARGSSSSMATGTTSATSAACGSLSGGSSDTRWMHSL